MQALCDAFVAACRAGVADGCAATFTADGIMYCAFVPPAVGRAAIAATHAGWIGGGQNKTLTIRRSACSGDVAWLLADFAEGHETGEGHSLCVCTRTPGGRWHIAVCSLTAA